MIIRVETIVHNLNITKPAVTALIVFVACKGQRGTKSQQCRGTFFTLFLNLNIVFSIILENVTFCQGKIKQPPHSYLSYFISFVSMFVFLAPQQATL